MTTDSVNWNVPGLYSWTVPSGVTTVEVQAFGADGGNWNDGNFYSTPTIGGQGSTLLGNLAVTPGETLYICVGGAGSSVSSGGGGGTGSGGYNGGGDGGNHTTISSRCGAGGGGATDIRRNGAAVGNRIVVIAGGGGAGAGGPADTGIGGDGGSAAYRSDTYGFDGDRGSYDSTSTNQGGGGGRASNNPPSNAGIGGLSGSGSGGGYSCVSQAQNVGGAGGAAGSSLSACGGGGGGGYWGGGGGAAGYNSSGAGGGAGSDYNVSLTSITYEHSKGSVGSADGSLSFAWDTSTTWTSSLPLATTAALTTGPGAVLSRSLGVSLSGISKLSPSSPALRRTGIPNLAATSSLISRSLLQSSLTFQAGSTLTIIPPVQQDIEAVSFAASSALNLVGVRSTIQGLAIAAIAEMAAQQLSGVPQISVLAALTIIPQLLSGTGLQIQTYGSMTDLGTIIRAAPLTMGASGSLTAVVLREMFGLAQMAANGAVGLSGALTEATGIRISPRASVALTAALTDIASLPILISSGLLELSNPIRHGQALPIQVLSSLTVDPGIIDIVGPLMSVYATLSIPHVELSQVLALAVIAQMLSDLSPGGGVYDPPYLTVTDANNTVQFFTTSFPNAGAVRQAVTNVQSGV